MGVMKQNNKEKISLIGSVSLGTGGIYIWRIN